ncbi:hypothetical protein QJS10_CPA03g00809 [Acorus calamus]|uniref:Uncharacterized protein n=1 Tax=Acorus calamus TaxID=4465 RepID=A0AAV9F6R6_ACOCL|nr:hypothetical protein QJS10_CPA03g00809 [Acorus calamus]
MDELGNPYHSSFQQKNHPQGVVPPRHELWKLIRTCKNGEPMNEYCHQIFVSVVLRNLNVSNLFDVRTQCFPSHKQLNEFHFKLSKAQV